MRHENQLTIVDHFEDWINDLRLATALLTRVPMPHPDGAMPAGLARAQRAFPLVGAMIGLVVGLADLSWLAIGIPPLAAATLALGASAALTGALHEDGLADVGDGFGGGRDRAAKLSIMRDSRLGTHRAICLLGGYSRSCGGHAVCPRRRARQISGTARGGKRYNGDHNRRRDRIAVPVGQGGIAGGGGNGRRGGRDGPAGMAPDRWRDRRRVRRNRAGRGNRGPDHARRPAVVRVSP